MKISLGLFEFKLVWVFQIIFTIHNLCTFFWGALWELGLFYQFSPVLPWLQRPEENINQINIPDQFEPHYTVFALFSRFIRYASTLYRYSPPKLQTPSQPNGLCFHISSVRTQPLRHPPTMGFLHDDTGDWNWSCHGIFISSMTNGTKLQYPELDI